ncbi:MAG: translation initiation factor IF-3 [Deltaproteobacteria bacterium]|nr:translation initiation factor IF-3 [Deltaproteobacteria bacterium]
MAYRDSSPPPAAPGPPRPFGDRPPFGSGPRPGGFQGGGPPGDRPGFGGGGPRGPRDDRPSEPRVNRRIRVREVRVIADDGAQLGILPTEEAMRRAEEKGLDLVEVQPMARPPVCKIMDYGKFKYQQKRKAAEQKHNQKVIEVKEVKFRPKTGKHDFDTKVRHLREFLGEGDKAKVTIMFRGREIVHPEIGHDVLKRVAEAIGDVAMIELAPRMEGRSMFMVVAPAKPGQKKTMFPAVVPMPPPPPPPATGATTPATTPAATPATTPAATPATAPTATATAATAPATVADAPQAPRAPAPPADTKK